jgi:hypothetical protein
MERQLKTADEIPVDVSGLIHKSAVVKETTGKKCLSAGRF